MFRLRGAALNTIKIFTSPIIIALLIGCGAGRNISGDTTSVNPHNNGSASANGSPIKAPTAGYPGKVIHVLVALCDNEHQGIVPVPPRIGNGEDPANNLYWGAAYGVKTFFSKSADWRLLSRALNASPVILERCVFKQQSREVYLIADAYRGAEIKQSLADFFEYASGGGSQAVKTSADSSATQLMVGGSADLIVFVGHNGLMDFSLARYPKSKDGRRRDAMILCCASKNYFAAPLGQTGATPLLWTTGLMAPEAYVLKTAIDGWVLGESGEAIRARAATAYHTYQKCGLKAARNLFFSGW